MRGSPALAVLDVDNVRQVVDERPEERPLSGELLLEALVPGDVDPVGNVVPWLVTPHDQRERHLDPEGLAVLLRERDLDVPQAPLHGPLEFAADLVALVLGPPGVWGLDTDDLIGGEAGELHERGIDIADGRVEVDHDDRVGRA